MTKKVLIVDDEADIREIIRLFMEEEGFEVIEASRGEEALDLAETEQPSIITLDILLPGMDGFEVIKLLKENTLTSSIPIIILSILSGKDIDNKRVFQEAIADYISKPFNPQELISSVKRIFSYTQTGKAARKKILIADDEPDVLDIISTSLNSAGYISLKASDGLEALNITRKSEPDLIILDIKMPNMDGFAVIQELKKDKATSSIPIVVLTGISLTDQDQSRIMKLGASRFLTKPFDASQLLNEIRNVLCQENVF